MLLFIFRCNASNSDGSVGTLRKRVSYLATKTSDMSSGQQAPSTTLATDFLPEVNFLVSVQISRCLLLAIDYAILPFLISHSRRATNSVMIPSSSHTHYISHLPLPGPTIINPQPMPEHGHISHFLNFSAPTWNTVLSVITLA